MLGWKFYIFVLSFTIQGLSSTETDLPYQSCSKSEPKSKPFVTYVKGTLQPKKSIAFLKTHKCASTTIQNILLRYAKKHELNLVLGTGGNYIGYPNGFSIRDVENTPWYQAGVQPDIFCLHSIWSNFSAIKQVMGQDAIHFTILRDPIDTFISMWDYFRLSDRYTKNKMSIDEFFKQNFNPKDVRIRFNEFSIKHVLLHEFGLPLDATEEMVDQKIQDIDQTFDLVMIFEHFDESMVLLRNLLQWNYEDLSSLKLNSVPKDKKSKISDLTRAKMRKWLEADYKLYDYFKSKLEQNIKYFGESEISQELKKYRQVQNQIKEKCPFEIVPRDTLPPDDQPGSRAAQPHKMLNEDPECQLIGMQEFKFVQLMRKEQNERIFKLKPLQNY